MDPSKPNWEQQAITELATEGLKEQRRTRRWGIFFKLLGFAYLFLVLMLFFDSDRGNVATERHTGLVDMTGIIADGENASADNNRCKELCVVSNSRKDVGLAR